MPRQRCRDENAMNLFWRRGLIRTKAAFLKRFMAFWGQSGRFGRARVKKNYFFLDFGTAEYYIDIIALRGGDRRLVDANRRLLTGMPPMGDGV
jgi:hypothetical protein